MESKIMVDPLNVEQDYRDEILAMRKNKLRRYTTVELSEPHIWGIFYKDRTLSTYEVCCELNDLAVENEKLKEEIKGFMETINGLEIDNAELRRKLMEK